MIPDRKNVQPNWQIFLTLVLILSMLGWNSSTAAAAGTTYYVDNTNPSCSDAGSGTTATTPFCTLGKAAGIAVAGDTVQVLAGTYAETVNGTNSGSAGSPITYSAAPGVTVTGNGSNAFRMSGKSYIVVDGFTVTGTADYGIYVFGSNHITISNNHVSYSGSPVSGSTRMGIYINSTTDSTISGNTTDHNSSHGILLTNGSDNNLVSNNLAFGNAEGWQRNANGIRLDASNNNTLLHNLTYGNEDSGMNIYTGSSGNFIIGNLSYGNGDHGIDFNAAPNNTVVGNTVQGNVTTGINFEGASSPGSGGATVANNLMVDNGSRLQIGGGTASGQRGNLRFDASSLSGDTLDYNLYDLNSGTVQIIWGSAIYATLADFQGAVGQETHGLQADPFFIAPAPVAQRPAAAPFNVAVNVGDYHLTSGSPAIDSANANAPNEPTSDIEGNSRVDDPFTTDSGAGTRSYDDRGAYEFQPMPGVALPAVTTQAVTNIIPGSATGNGTLTDLGAPDPTQHGVVWGTAANPTISDHKSMDGPLGTTGAFTSNITGLASGTLYHVRAYAWNAAGIAYGEDVSFTSAYNDYYVDNTNPSCSDAGSGTTPATPFCTIGKAASIAVAGDTVRALAGSYAETVSVPNSGSAGLPITYSAAPGVTVTGNGSASSGGAFRIPSKSYITIDGFTITGTADYGIYVFGSNHITLSNNHVSSSGGPAASSTRAGIYLNSTTASTVSGNTTEYNSSHGIQLTNGSDNNLVSDNISFGNAQEYVRDASGIRLDGSNNNTFLHNITYGNEDSGMTFYTGSSGNFIIGNLAYGNGDHGFDFNAAPNNTVVGNTVQGNVTTGINFEGATAPGSGGATVINNLMVDNGLRLQIGGGTASGQPGNLRFDARSLKGDSLDYNIFYLNSGTVEIQWNGTNYSTLAAFKKKVAGQEGHGLEADPLFIAPAPIAQRPAAAPFNVTVNVGDYHLTSGSPAIDSANSNAPSEPILDIESNPRVDDPSTKNSGAGTRPYDDRGAYEFQPANVAPTPTATATSSFVLVCLPPLQDSYIIQDASTQNHGNDTTLRIKPDAGKERRTVIGFDLTSIPPSSTVITSTLRLYETNTRGSQTISVYRLTNSWVESQVTWNNRSTGTPWITAGGDFQNTQLASFSPNLAKQYRDIDVTSVTQGWLNGSFSNYGLLLDSTGANGEVSFVSSEGSNTSQRPQLCVTYQQALPSATPIVTATFTATNTPTATATFTNTPLSTATSTNTPLPTATATGIPTFTPTNTPLPTDTTTPQLPTFTPTITFTPTPTVAPSSLTFIANADSYVREASNSNYGTSAQLWVDGDIGASYESYLKFSVSGITGTVQSAILRVYSTSFTVDGPTVYATTNDWTEAGINGNTLPALTSSGLDDKGTIASGVWSEYNVAPVITGDGTYSFGLIPTSTDAVSFSSREGSQPPQLVITFAP